MKLTIIPPQAVDGLWPLLAAGFEKACRRAGAHDLNAGQLWHMARKGDGILILASNEQDILQASIWSFDGPENEQNYGPDYDVDQARTNATFSFRCIMLYGKNMRQWYQPMRQLVEKIAIDNGAMRLVTKGRRGWLRQCHGARRLKADASNQIDNNDYEVDLTHGR